jgi:hypothetical protein
MTGVSTTPGEVPMLILLAIPVIVAVAFVHRLIQVVAPSNLLVRNVRAARPSGRLAAALVCSTAVLLFTMHVLADAVSAGAPGWLNLVVLVLAWDALKAGWLAVSVIFRGMIRVVCHSPSRAWKCPQPTS